MPGKVRYCSGFYTNQRVSDDLRLVSGEQSEYKITLCRRDIVYLSKGANQGVKPGDRFSVVRESKDPLRAILQVAGKAYRMRWDVLHDLGR
jgi:hypothetical protein